MKKNRDYVSLVIRIVIAVCVMAAFLGGDLAGGFGVSGPRNDALGFKMLIGGVLCGLLSFTFLVFTDPVDPKLGVSLMHRLMRLHCRTYPGEREWHRRLMPGKWEMWAPTPTILGGPVVWRRVHEWSIPIVPSGLDGMDVISTIEFDEDGKPLSWGIGARYRAADDGTRLYQVRWGSRS